MIFLSIRLFILSPLLLSQPNFLYIFNEIPSLNNFLGTFCFFSCLLIDYNSQYHKILKFDLGRDKDL